MKKNIDIWEVLGGMTLSEKEEAIKASYKNYKAFLYDAVYEAYPDIIKEIMDEIIVQEELLNFDEDEALTAWERNK